MKILVLSTWFPFPMTEGGKIRAYHLTRALANKHDVTLISFAGARVAPAAIAEMSRFCRNVEVIQHDPFEYARWDRLRGWLSKYPSSVGAGYSDEMRKAVQRIASEWRPDAVVAMTFVTAPYALELPGVVRILERDFCVSEMLFESYARAKGWLARSRAWLAWRKFRSYETELLKQSDLSPAVSRRDQELLVELYPVAAGRVPIVPNGVDTSVMRRAGVSPIPNTLVFNGALRYGPNFDAMEYFLHEILPAVRAEVPEVLLRITGATESVPMDRLCTSNAVEFTGFVDDIRPVVSASWVCIVPLRMGGGTRVKILEAMALGTPVVSTSKGAEGLEVEDGVHLLIADTPKAFASTIVTLLRDPALRERLARNARQLVEKQYDWGTIGSHFATLIENCVGAEA